MYNKSELHYTNLEKARKAAVEQKADCEICGKTVSKSGFKNHVAACKNGKHCPVCNVWFRGKATTCSRGCANSYFRSGEKNPNWKNDRYRSTCFIYHDKKCCVCGEANIVEVHHFDEDRSNNSPENLIPLCPTHHQYMHSRYKGLIRQSVVDYIDRWTEEKRKALKKSPETRMTPKSFKFESKWKNNSPQ